MSESKADSNWQQPSRVHGPRCKGFLMSHLNPNAPSHSRKAKCSYCSQIFTEEHPHHIFNHTKDSCLKITASKKIKYIHDVIQTAQATKSEDQSGSGASARASSPPSKNDEGSLPIGGMNSNSA
ncbi:hypothetical protein O181_009649 [Austropuccinia psidii MF-1]|uniref:Uncharacterized protein n=1 Tax=Austropuccinia psidii MF-1 TaxID=1389203 RepID=A0A9Q3BPN2_9BASI|nr:hypothetical protein [Austropuccinia psidii MF-1]